MPFYYRKLPDNIKEVNTVNQLVKDLRFLKYDRINLVMDQCLYGEEDINYLYYYHVDFFIGVNLSLKFVSAEIEKISASIHAGEHYNEKHDLYTHVAPIKWNCLQKTFYKGDTFNGECIMYLYIVDFQLATLSIFILQQTSKEHISARGTIGWYRRKNKVEEAFH